MANRDPDGIADRVLRVFGTTMIAAEYLYLGMVNTECDAFRTSSYILGEKPGSKNVCAILNWNEVDAVSRTHAAASTSKPLEASIKITFNLDRFCIRSDASELTSVSPAPQRPTARRVIIGNQKAFNERIENGGRTALPNTLIIRFLPVL
ncbi:hypothetical protein F4778DRAFT_788531 [Xylariomycetidae sp. FL2044]|nr:hypothetical protein F4778DRAFT_788531 [Xylariomycetidae sp. FL2044]